MCVDVNARPSFNCIVKMCSTLYYINVLFKV